MTVTSTATPTSRLVGTFLAPRSIALIGVSHRGGPSRGILQNLQDGGFAGELYLVNPAGGEIEGMKCHPEVADLPGPPDLALVVAPADQVADVIRDCGASGIPAAIVFSAGFADDRTPVGRQREEALAEAVSATGIRVVGPNCLGFLNLRARTAASWSSSIAYPRIADHFTDHDEAPVRADQGVDAMVEASGSVAIVAQSGGLGFSLFNRGLARGLRFSHVISAGNEADLEVQDFVDFLLDDAHTTVILLYVEGLKDPARLQACAARAEALGKHLVVAKVGRSAVAARAAMSHTGHLAGDDRAFDAVFDRYGVTRVHDVDEMLDVGLVLSICPAPAGRRTAIVSYSGGNAVWMADACDDRGLVLPELSTDTQARLNEILPSFAATANPVDISGASKVSPANVLSIVAQEPDIDALVLIASYHRVAAVEADRPALEQLIEGADKPVLLYSYTEPSPEAHAMLRQIGVPSFTSTARCARSLQALVDAGSHQAEPPDTPWAFADVARQHADSWPATAASITEHTTKQLLRSVGLRTTRERLATNAVEAAVAATDLGYPVALKVQSPDLAHKARHGGVVLGLTDASAVKESFDDALEAVVRSQPDAQIDGALIQEMVPMGLEVLVGVQNTSGLGPMVVVGLGGPLAEALQHTVLHPAPFGEATARRLIDRLRLGEMLAHGGRGGEPVLEALATLVSAVSRLADTLRDALAELDLNPLMFDPVTGEPVVVDALAVPAVRPGMLANAAHVEQTHG